MWSRHNKIKLFRTSTLQFFIVDISGSSFTHWHSDCSSPDKIDLPREKEIKRWVKKEAPKARYIYISETRRNSLSFQDIGFRWKVILSSKLERTFTSLLIFKEYNSNSTQLKTEITGEWNNCRHPRR